MGVVTETLFFCIIINANIQMDPITCFLNANPRAKYTGDEVAYNGSILRVLAYTSLTDLSDLHWVADATEFIGIEELGNTGEYIAFDITE